MLERSRTGHVVEFAGGEARTHRRRPRSAVRTHAPGEAHASLEEIDAKRAYAARAASRRKPGPQLTSSSRVPGRARSIEEHRIRLAVACSATPARVVLVVPRLHLFDAGHATLTNDLRAGGPPHAAMPRVSSRRPRHHLAHEAKTEEDQTRQHEQHDEVQDRAEADSVDVALDQRVHSDETQQGTSTAPETPKKSIGLRPNRS